MTNTCLQTETRIPTNQRMRKQTSHRWCITIHDNFVRKNEEKNQQHLARQDNFTYLAAFSSAFAPPFVLIACTCFSDRGHVGSSRSSRNSLLAANRNDRTMPESVVLVPIVGMSLNWLSIAFCQTAVWPLTMSKRDYLMQLKHSILQKNQNFAFKV